MIDSRFSMQNMISRMGGRFAVLLMLGCNYESFSDVVISRPICDFGEIASTSIVMRSYEIVNESESIMGIADIQSSCDCLHILKYPQSLYPRSTNYVDVVLQPVVTGDVSYIVTINLADSSSSSCSFELRGVVHATDQGLLPKDRSTDISTELLTQKMLSRDLQAYMGPAEAIALSKKTQCAILDVRSGDEYDAVHIPGSLHVPLYAIQTKNYLRDRSLLLVDGYGLTSSLEEKCRQLRAMGFKSVRILYGGLSAWKRVGGPLQGHPRAIAELDSIDAALFYSARQYDDCMVIDASTNASKVSPWLIPGAMPQTNLANVVASSSAGWPSSNRFLTALIVDDHGRSSSSRVMEWPAFTSVVVLAGGLDGYRQFLRKATAQLSPRTMTLTRVAGSANVKSPVSMPSSIKKSCGSCRGK